MSVVWLGLVFVALPTSTFTPVGADVMPRVVVAGSSRTESVAVAPALSVTVRRSSRCDGYSWSGAENEPDATPGNVWTVCSWQSDGLQWWRISVQVRADGGSAPSSSSEPEPLKDTWSPTDQWSEDEGVSICASGGELLAFTLSSSVSDRPLELVTRSVIG